MEENHVSSEVYRQCLFWFSGVGRREMEVHLLDINIYIYSLFYLLSGSLFQMTSRSYFFPPELFYDPLLILI